MKLEDSSNEEKYINFYQWVEKEEQIQMELTQKQSRM